MRIQTNLFAAAAVLALAGCGDGLNLDGDQRRFVTTCTGGGYPLEVCACAIGIAKDNLSPDLYAAVLAGREGVFPPFDTPDRAGSGLNRQAQVNKEIVLYAYTVTNACGYTVPLM